MEDELYKVGDLKKKKKTILVLLSNTKEHEILLNLNYVDFGFLCIQMTNVFYWVN